MTEPKITRLELIVFEHNVADLGVDYNGFNQVYQAGNIRSDPQSILRVHTDTGVIGEYFAGAATRASSDLDLIAGYIIVDSLLTCYNTT